MIRILIHVFIISITVNNEDAWYYLYKSHYFVKIKLFKYTDDTVYAEPDMISITKNMFKLVAGR